MLTRKELLTLWKADDARGLLLPICFIAGIALYFALPFEPGLAAVVPLFAAFIWWLIARRYHYRTQGISLAILLLTVGLGWATIYTSQFAHTMLARPITPRPVTGIIEDIEPTTKGQRITLAEVTIAGMETAETPRRVRLSMRGTNAKLMIGDSVKLMAGLMPPMGPALPHGFDFARYFFFRDIGAVGYGLNPITVTAKATNGEGWNATWARWRHSLTQNIMQTLPSPHGAIASGLIIGEDAAIPPEVHDELRAANLLHVIAISGAHMVVIAGIVFIALRLLFLLLPGFGQRPFAKQVAAGVTLMALTGYLLITGLMLSAVRAYIMMALVLGAVMLGRDVLPMRSIILAAVLMLCLDPSDLLEPGFQLSFAATMAIIAFVFSRDIHESQTWRTPLKYLGWLMMMSVVAESATAPLVVHHFNTVSVYGVFANTLLSPIIAIFIMPPVALYFLLLPFGAEALALHIMSFGTQAMLGVAKFVSTLPHALIFLPSIPGWGVALFIGGLSWLCILTTRLRLAGVAPMVIGVLSIFTVSLPDMVVTGELKQIVLKAKGEYHLVRGRTASLIPELWANGTGNKALPYTRELLPQWRCDTLGCIAFGRVALPYSDLALLEDCKRADVVILKYGTKCRNGTRVIETYKQPGVIGIWLGKKLRIETSSDWQGDRPWSN